MTQAIFLSYASQDAEAAHRICDTLRAAGLEVWFDQSELRGGDAWDASIRKQIKECALFVPIISSNTQQREEGYFRLEWKLAVDRSHLMADDKAFFFPVVLDDVAEPKARVPDKFRERQWSRLNDDAATTLFAERIAKLVAGSASSSKSASASPPVLAFAPAVAASTQNHAIPSISSNATPSIAVLAFANRSASADDEYFSDGLADELLNVLARIKGLRVAARTSAFSFKGKQATVAEIGRALNVATILEGSVRKSGNRVRISVELVKVADGYHLWSETYDRTLDDIFAVQDDIAQAVVKELRTTLMGETASVAQTSKVTAEVAAAVQGRSENSEAHRLLLQARFFIDRHAAADLLQGIQYLRQALTIDPEYALALAWLSRALTDAASLGSAPVEESNTEALAAARRALQLVPDLLEAQLAICWHKIMYEWDWRGAETALQHALTVAPGNADAMSVAALLYHTLGRMEEAIGYARRSVEQDPLNMTAYRHLAQSLAVLGRFDEAEQAYRKAIGISPEGPALRYRLAMVLEKHGRHSEAIAEATNEKADWARWNALAILHFLGGEIAESDRALNALVENLADRAAFQIAMCYAVRGNADAAFEWLERAYAQRDSGLTFIKAWWVLESLYGDPRWSPFLKRMGLAD